MTHLDLHTSWRTLHQHLQTHLHSHSYGCTKKWNQMSLSRWTDQENVEYINNGILVSRKEKWNHGNCSKMYGTWDHYVRWLKGDSDKYHIFSYCRLQILISVCVYTGISTCMVCKQWQEKGPEGRKERDRELGHRWQDLWRAEDPARGNWRRWGGGKDQQRKTHSDGQCKNTAMKPT